MGFSYYRTALVTDASSGIGAATVRRQSAEELEVYAVARDEARLATLSEEAGCQVGAVEVSDPDAPSALAKSAEFNVLVNNASQSRCGNILDTTSEDVDTLIDVNLRTVSHLTRPIVPGMASRGRGHVVNISAIVGHYAFDENATTFNSSDVHRVTKQALNRCRSNCGSTSTDQGSHHRSIAPPDRDQYLPEFSRLKQPQRASCREVRDAAIRGHCGGHRLPCGLRCE